MKRSLVITLILAVLGVAILAVAGWLIVTWPKSAAELNQLPPADEQSLPPETKTVDNPDKPYVAEGCMIGGCSAQLCGEAGEADSLISTCEWRAEYACYAHTRCERQANGRCGWTDTPELQACLSASTPEPGSDVIPY